MKEGATLTEADVKAFCQGQIARYKVPRYVKFVDAFPMTVTGKIQKFVMRQTSIAELGLAPAARPHEPDTGAMSTDLLTPIRSGAAAAVSPVTVRQWAQKGMIQARTTPGGHRRFTREAIIDFARRMAMTLPDGFVAETGVRVLIVDGERQSNDALSALLKQQTADVEVEIAHDAFSAGRARIALHADADSARPDAARHRWRRGLPQSESRREFVGRRASLR